MRNLKITSCSVLPSKELIACAHCFCLDCDHSTVWVATLNELCCIENEKVCSMVPLSGHMTSGDRVIGMEYLTDSESVCLAISSGNILLLNVTTYELESVGEIEVGVVCMAWSPEQDIVVMVTGEDKLVLMTKDFDPLTETVLHQKDFGEAKPINVGWGKKETQFHGSEGKQAAKSQEKKLKPALERDDRRTRISWRGDGEYFSCSAIDLSSGSRIVRIWSRECTLHSTCETIEGLEHTLAWKPSGNLLASTQLKPHRNDVIFFERNGLQHGEFTVQSLPSDLQVKELSWSNDSAVLGIWCGRGEGRDREEWVQLWTVGNYHWYLKQEIRFPGSKVEGSATPTTLTGLLWDPIIPLKLHILTSDGQYLSYTWHWIISESKSHSESNISGVSVIDGCQILHTPFRFCIIPPPMSANQLLLPASVNEVACSPFPHCNDFLTLLSNLQIAVISLSESKENDTSQKMLVPPPPSPQLIGITSIDEMGSGFHSLRQLVWWREGSLLGVTVDTEGGEEGGACKESVVQFSLSVEKESKSVKITKCCSIVAPGPILCVYSNPDTSTAIVQLTSGEVWKISPVDSESFSLTPWELDSGCCLTFGEHSHCEKMELAFFNGKECVVGLCEARGSLFVNDLKVATGCTSFAVHDEFFLLTTNTHTCRFIPLNLEPRVLQPLDQDKPRALDEKVRRVERGSRIVTAVPHDIKLVLQMPRGNLETIFPRALVLSEVRKKLDRVEFGTAFRTMRKHRINLNLIHDHNPKIFMDNLPIFIGQMTSIDHINLFLAEVGEQDVCKTMYPQASGSAEGGGLAEEAGQEAEQNGSKVNRVCEALRKVLVEMGENKYLLPIITTYVKMTDPQLETVLSIIQKIKDSPASSRPSSGSEDIVTAEKALKYTIFLVDVNELYDVALGMYDLPLVVMVAEKSQKDPKEYLPFLNKLRKLPLNYKRYTIDKHLKRYGKALQHIAKCGPEKFEECLSLLKEHSLYNEALGIFTDRNSDEYKEIARAFGHHLMDTGKHKDAGIIFSQCGCHKEAFGAFEKAGCWQQAFVAAAILQYSRAEKMEAARRMARALKSSRRYFDASQTLLDYAEDVEEAIVALLEGSCWEEALRQLHLHQRVDLLETHFVPGLLEAQESRLALFKTLHDDFKRHSLRLAIVRESKKQKQAAILEGTYAPDEKDADLFSDTSSVMTGQSALSSLNTSLRSSQYSKTTGKSSKNRRKAERKKHSLREGTAHEEEALVEALGEIVSTVDCLQDDMGSLLGVLVQFGYTKEASEVQKGFVQLLDMVKCNMDTIWTQENSRESANNQGKLGPDATVNSILASMATAKQPHVNSGGCLIGPAPKLRDNMKWRLASIT